MLQRLSVAAVPVASATRTPGRHAGHPQRTNPPLLRRRPVRPRHPVRDYQAVSAQLRLGPAASTGQVYHHLGVSGRIWSDNYTPSGRRLARRNPGLARVRLGVPAPALRRRERIHREPRGRRGPEHERPRAGRRSRRRCSARGERRVFSLGFRTAGVVSKKTFAYLESWPTGATPAPASTRARS